MTLRGLPHYKQLNFGGGSDWLGATTAALMGTTQAGDKNQHASEKVECFLPMNCCVINDHQQSDEM